MVKIHFVFAVYAIQFTAFVLVRGKVSKSMLTIRSTSKKIAKGDELYINYGLQYWRSNKPNCCYFNGGCLKTNGPLAFCANTECDSRFHLSCSTASGSKMCPPCCFNQIFKVNIYQILSAFSSLKDLYKFYLKNHQIYVYNSIYQYTLININQHFIFLKKHYVNR